MKPWKLGVLPCALALLCGCASKPVVIVSSKPLCAAVRNVCISKDDELTEGTASQIEGNNLARAKLCGKPKPCKA